MKRVGILTALVFMIFIFSFLSPVFVSSTNIINILNHSAIIGIISFGMSIVIFSGGIDLSVGSILAFSGIVLAICLSSGLSIFFSIIICLCVGAVLGLANGLLIAYLKIPAFIATLGLMSAFRGAALLFSDGRSISNLPNSFNVIAFVEVLKIPLAVYVFLFVFLLMWWVLKYVYWGHYLFAVGGNEKAAWLTGINVNVYKASAYIISGLMASVSAILLVSRLNSAQPQAGAGYEMDAIAAVVLGGGSFSGGKGDIVGTFVGILIIGVLQNGLSIMNIPTYYQQMLVGVIIIAAVIFDNNPFKKGKNMKSKSFPVYLLTSIFVLAIIVITLRQFNHEKKVVKKLKIGFVVPTLENPFFVEMTNAAKKTVDSLGNAEIVIFAPQKVEDANGQNQMVDNLITMKVDAICVVPTSSESIIPVIKKANDAAIPIINIDNKVDATIAAKQGAKITTYIGSDNFDGGKLAGTYIAERLNGKGKIAILEGVSGNDAANKRKAGFLESIKKYPELVVVTSQVANWNRDLAFNKFQNILQSNKDLNAVFACNDEMALGAYSALVQMNIRKEKVIIVGFDAVPEAVVALKAGKIDATIAQQPSLMGRQAIQMAVSIISKKVIANEYSTELKIVKK